MLPVPCARPTTRRRSHSAVVPRVPRPRRSTDRPSFPIRSWPPLTGQWNCSEPDRRRAGIMVRPMTETDNDRREPAPDDSDPVLPFDDFEVESETLPDGRQIHYY